MVIFAIISSAIGLWLGWRFGVLSLVPCILGGIVIVTVFDVGHHQSVRTAVITLVLSLGLLQIGYLMGRVFKTSFRAYFPAEPTGYRRPAHPPVRAAGRQG